MGKFFFYLLLFLIVVTVLAFVFGMHKFAYISGFILISIALGVGYVYSARDDRRF
ncbi:hypothetical protein [Neobacillus sp. LXY-1]|uniref:hypothetical protein n=1 Tax=Neobacillus sp. LXY-1 TaxID=3379133 RepID=UPI003EE38816